MDVYPLHYVSHNLPLIVLFGLGSTNFQPRDATEEDYPVLQEKGIYISSDFPSVTGKTADELLECFRDFDAKDAAWNNRPGKGKMGTMGFTYRNVGRALTLPPHKAKPPPLSPSLQPVNDGPPRKPSLIPILHSPLSPLTPGSPTYPDGIMTSFWFSKHQTLLPCTILSFFNFTLDVNNSTLQDNKLKTEINAIRSSMTTSSYKICFVGVLVCEDDGPGSDMDDRVATIRRATTLDSKSLFVLPQDQSSIEIRAFVGTILAAIQPSCIDYYRDLTKHARRKRNRGTVPPPTAPPISGTSKTLSNQGWAVRYETKLGCFAEFRQEMDSAGRSYETAYELLLDGDVFDSISSWSPRFNEARMLADALALRILRCLLWSGQTTSAAQSWSNHRARMQDLIDRKGKGSGTYGWMAWEATWSAVMAELIERVDVPIFHVPQQPQSASTLASEIPDIYAIPEKAFDPEERLPPWDLLHHEGYWLTRAAKCTRARRKLAYAMPKEDRTSPGQSPASQVANQSHMYDTYLCPEPHIEFALPGNNTFDYAGVLAKTLRGATTHFSRRNQTRAVEKTELDVAREYMRVERWNDAMGVLKPIWQKLSWRRAAWWKLVEEVSWAVRACARHTGDGETLVVAEWELMSSSLTPRPNWQYNFSKCLDGLDIEEKPYAVVNFEAVAPTLSATLVFGISEARVGVPLPLQLTVISQAQNSSSAITVAEVQIALKGGLRGFHIQHAPDKEPVATSTSRSIGFYDVSLHERPLSFETTTLPPSSPSGFPPLYGSSNLSFSPGTTKVFALSLLPRDAGDVKAIQAVLGVREELFELQVVIPLHEQPASCDWWIYNDSNVSRKTLAAKNGSSIEVLPKPPKIKLELPSTHKSYYTDEQVDMPIITTNDEDDDVEVSLELSLVGSLGKVPQLHWITPSGEAQGEHYDNTVPEERVTHTSNSYLAGRTLGQLAPSASRTEVIGFKALPEMTQYTLEIKALYHLLSDPDTPISKTITREMVFIGPFEANYNFSPRVHPEPWPSYFSILDDKDDLGENPTPNGLKQQWSLSARIASFAIESLIIESVTLEIISIRQGAICSITQNEEPDPNTVLEPNAVLHRSFPLEVQKLNLEDRRTSIASLQVCISWRRNSSSSPATVTSLTVQPLTVPFGEPRVLASASPVTSSNSLSLVHLSYILENPSMHLLTFSLSMEASDDFAFSGPKATTVQLVPLSRHKVDYNLMPTQRGIWIWPVMNAVDVGFGKTLKVGAGEGCRGDAKGIGIWVDAKGEGSAT